MSSEPIFIHASWRSASTYVWSKFRHHPDAYAYFEPLNEHLTTATQEFIDGFRPWSFAHHPPLSAPYLEEFRPLIRPTGGVPGFPSRLSYGHYCAGRTADLADLKSYLDDLALLARQHGRRPVYGFVRTDLRVGWFRGHMPGKHIFVRREPRRQFLSMLRQAAKRNPYFLQRGAGHPAEQHAHTGLRPVIDRRRPQTACSTRPNSATRSPAAWSTRAPCGSCI